MRLVTPVAGLVFLLASESASAQSVAPHHPLAGCWRVDATRTITVDGSRDRLETIDFVGFAASRVHSTLTRVTDARLYTVDTPSATGFATLTLSADRSGGLTLSHWVPDHGRYMTRAWQARHHAIHPLHVATRWALHRCVVR